MKAPTDADGAVQASDQSLAALAAPTYGPLRLTIPVREALAQGGCRVAPDGAVTLSGVVPTGIVECLIGHGSDQHRGLRLASEPTYPGEWPEGAVAWHERGSWTPCPKCAHGLVWYEAGGVPGYRICVRGHHAMLSADGRSAREVRS